MSRNRRMIGNIILAFIVKGGAVIVGVLTVPAYMAFFSNTIILGVWYTLLSLLTWVLNFDLGIGNGLRNMLVTPLIENNQNRIKELISSAYISIGIVSVCILFIGIVGINALNLNSILNIDDSIIEPAVLSKSFVIVLVGIVGQFFLKLVTSILNAQEKTAISSALPLLSNIIVLIFVSLFTKGNDENKLLAVSWVYVAAINLPYLFASIIVFSKLLRKSIPSLHFFRQTIAKKILSLGSGFFAIQIALLIITVTNEFLITRFYGADKVVEYQVYNKIFYTIVTLFSLITNPIWSSITTAYCNNKIDWIEKVYKYLLIIAALASICTLLLAFAMQSIVNLWLQDQSIHIETKKYMSFVFYSAVMIFCYAESCIANGMSKLKTQMRCYIFAACIKIPLCYVFYRIFNDWETIVLANGIALFPYIIFQHLSIKRDLDKEQTR